MEEAHEMMQAELAVRKRNGVSRRGVLRIACTLLHVQKQTSTSWLPDPFLQQGQSRTTASQDSKGN